MVRVSHMLPFIIACAGLPFLILPHHSLPPAYNAPALPSIITPDQSALTPPDPNRQQRLIDTNPFSPSRQAISVPTSANQNGGAAGDPQLLGTVVIEEGGPVAILKLGQKTYRAQKGQVVEGWLIQQIGTEICDVSRGNVKLRLSLRPKIPQRQQTPPGV